MYVYRIAGACFLSEVWLLGGIDFFECEFYKMVWSLIYMDISGGFLACRIAYVIALIICCYKWYKSSSC